MALLDGVDHRNDQERTLLSELSHVALELGDGELITGLIPFLDQLSDEAFRACSGAEKACH